jgi:mono/diheme cytochrome c family protein
MDRQMKKIVSAVLVAAVAATLVAGAARADDDAAIAPAVNQVNEKYSQYNLDIKKLFAQKCSWCHQGYGMRKADGPRLAGTSKTYAQVVKQITSGNPPMPGFKSQLKEYEIQALADYIKALPND